MRYMPAPVAFTYESETAAYIAALSVPMSLAMKRALNYAIKTSKPLWTGLDGLYLHAVGAEADARLNVMTPGVGACTLTGAGPTHTAWRGVAGDGAATGYNTGINPSLGTTKYALDAAMMAVWSLTNNNVTGADMGSGSGSRVNSRNSTTAVMRPNAAVNASIAITSSIGLIGFSRQNNANVDVFRNDVLLGNVTSASSGITNANVGICHANTSFSVRQLALSVFGNLTQAQMADFYKAWLPYMQTVGAA